MTRRYKNEGRDQINVENARDIYVGGDRSRKRPDRETTWLKAFEKEIEGRLATSLHNQILINLGKQTQPEQVHRLWDMEVKSGQTTETISPETEILAVFDRAEIAGKLLILGKPGAGKTTTLLELARALVRKALDDPSEPMPFLLNLSSWKDPKLSIKDWAIAELTTKGIGSKLGAKWIAEQKVLPLLDGLDEVRSDLQTACVTAINQFLGGEEQPRSIVVCSRGEEYELYPERLNLNGAIYLQELSDPQIESYLERVDRSALWDVLSRDAELLDLVRQPLLLSITLVAYRKELAAQWQALLSTQERLTFLLAAYVEKMLHREVKSRFYEGKEPTTQQTRQWLVRLAQQLKHDDETELLIEKMQPTWLRTSRRKWAYRLIAGLIVGLMLWLISELILVLIVGLILVLIVGLIVELIFHLIGMPFGGINLALIVGLIDELDRIELIEEIRISMSSVARKEFYMQSVSGLIVGYFFGLVG
ncbi:NACHT domain-containing protein [Phormidesmis sp. 146-35]